MKNIIPDYILKFLSNRYIAGVARAEFGYRYSKSDEDSLTGALGQELFDNWKISGTDGHVYQVSIYYIKMRGRGKGAPEKKIGADGIFQIEVTDINGKIIKRKGLLFQAKNKWKTTNKDLLRQAKLLLHLQKDSLVIDYAPEGYKGCLVEDVVKAGADKRKLKNTKLLPLGLLLGQDFLFCNIGTADLYYDVDKEKLYETWKEQELDVGHIISTHIHQKD